MEFPRTSAYTHSLPGGSTIILDPVLGEPVISLQVWVETGSMHEGDRIGSGLSHLLEHFVFKGTKSFSGKQLVESVQAAGGQWNAYTTFDRTVYYINGPATSLPDFLKILAELVFRPTFPKEAFETEKEVIRREIAMGLDDPDSVASQQLFTTFYQHDPRRHPVIGHRDRFDLLTYEDMIGYHQSRYGYDNTFFAISGKFDPSLVIETLAALFDDLPRHFSSNPRPLLPEPPQRGSRHASASFDIPATKLVLAWPTPDLLHPDQPSLDLLALILGGGSSSRLYQNLHEKNPLANHIDSWNWNPKNGPGMLAVSAELDPEKLSALVDGIQQEVQNLLVSDLSEEIQRAQRKALASQFRTLETASGRASDLASNWYETRSLDFTHDYLASLNAVTPDSVRQAASRYIMAEKLTQTTLTPVTKVSIPKSVTSTILPTPTIHHLSNGLPVILRPNPRVPTLSIQLASRAGRLIETTQNSGIGELHSTTLLKGTTTRTSKDISTTIDDLGAGLSVSSGNNTTLISAFALSEDLPAILTLLHDLLENPIFPADAIDRERKNQLIEIEEINRDPLKLAFLNLRSNLFGSQGYGLPLCGSPDALATLTSSSLKSYHQNIITPANSVLSIFGDLDPTSTLSLLEESLGTLPAGEALELPKLPANNHPQESVQHHLDKQQAVLVVGFPGVHLASPDIPALDLIHEYCSDMAGPLFGRIREELGLAYYVGTTHFHGFHQGLFAFYLGTSPEQIDLAKTELLKEIHRLRTDGIPPQALQRTKATVLANLAIANQSNASLARTTALNTLFGLGTHYHENIPQQIERVTPEQIQKTTKKYFDKSLATISLITPKAQKPV